MRTQILHQKFVGTDDLRRDLTSILKTLKKKGGQVVITQHGKPQAVLIGVNHYLDLDEINELIADSDPKLIKEVNEAIADVRAGNYITAEEVYKKLGI